MAGQQTPSENHPNINFKELTAQILDSYLNSADAKDMSVLSPLDENMSVIGTGKHEFYRNLEEFTKSFQFDTKEREHIHFHWEDMEIEEQWIDDSHVLVYGFVLILGTLPDGQPCIHMDSRFSLLYGFIDGNWRVLHIHHSVPDKDQQTEFSYNLGKEYTESRQMIEALTEDFTSIYIIEPESDLAVSMKVDPTVMESVTGAGESFCYSKAFRAYAEKRIYGSDTVRFLHTIMPEALISAFADGAEKVELLFRVLIDNKPQSYSGLYRRFSRPGEPLKLVAGFKNIDDFISMRRKNREEGIYSAYSAVSDLYLAMFRVDIPHNIITSIKTTNAILRYSLPGNQAFDENIKAILTGLAMPDSLLPTLQFLDIRTIAQRLRGKTHISAPFSGKIAGACKLHIIRENSDVTEDPEHVVIALEVLDDEWQQVFSGLARGFKNVYMINLEHGTVKVLKSQKSYLSPTGHTINVVNRIYPYDEHMRAWIATYVHPDDREMLRKALSLAHLREHFAKEKEYTGNFRMIIKGREGNYQFDMTVADEEGHIIAGIQNIDAIIAEHLAAEKAEKEKDENLKEQLAIFDALADSYANVYLVNPVKETLRVLKLNGYLTTGVERVVAKTYPYETVKAQYVSERVHPDDRDMMMKAISLPCIKEGLSENTEYTGNYRVLSEGETHYYQYKYIKLKGLDHIIAGFQNVDDIIAEQQKHQKALASALAAAQQANKAKSTFLNSMSHDIRTPMNAIIGFTALAQTHLDNREQVQDYLEKISTSSTHLLSLINDILDMSRIESGTVKLEEKQVHIPDLLHDLRTMIQGLVNSKNLNLYIDTQDVVHEDVVTDKLRLNQVLINIVGNAIKFTKPGGDIIIRLVEKPSPGKSYTNFEFSVKDNGIGMSKEFVGHIFDTFSREFSSTVSGIQGSGLGMAITKNIVDMMGGEISVESELGKGSLFTVKLRLRLADHSVTHEPIPALLGARALVVDDDLNTCRSVSKMLRDIQMRPDWTASGKEAVIRAQDAAEMNDEYKVYIIDYLMPDMNGIETVRRIRKVISEDAAIIVLTAYDWTDFEHEAREAGVTAFVSKPIFMSELREVLTQPSVSESAAEKGNEQDEKKYDYTGKHILLVEDNELNREIATAILEETGMTIDSVNDGDVAVATILEKPADTYDLILMDVQMPKMDGYTATREIRTLADNKKANIPIVAMTANAFDEDRDKAYAAGMNGHIIKPISIDAIARVLDGIFSGR